MKDQFCANSRRRRVSGNISNWCRLQRPHLGINLVPRAAASRQVEPGALSSSKFVKGVGGLSTCNASFPINLHKADKGTAVEHFVAAIRQSYQQEMCLAVVPVFSKVMSGHGSVVPSLHQVGEPGELLSVRGELLPSVWFSYQHAVRRVVKFSETMMVVNIFVRLIGRLKLLSLVAVFVSDVSNLIRGTQAGRKPHKEITSSEESQHTFLQGDLLCSTPWLRDLRSELATPEAVPVPLRTRPGTGDQWLLPEDPRALRETE